jgi:hypothetical protein
VARAKGRPPGGHGGRPRTSRPKAELPGPGASARRSSRDLLEFLETLGEEFDEAGLHVLQRREFTGVSLSAVRPLPVERLTPGAVGWLREVRATAPSRIVEGEAVESLLGWLYFVMHPNRPFAPTDPATESPLLGTPWNEFIYSEESTRAPHTLLAARAESEGSAAVLRRFAEQVAHELESESES